MRVREALALRERRHEALDVAEDDPYGEATAEFYDLLAADGWDTFGIQLLDLLDGVDPTVGPIVDVGSGTGVGLHHLRQAALGARLFAVEPSKAMRVALHARLAADAELRRATTVFPAKFGDARLPERAAAIVVNAALGHLSDAERDRLWRYAAERLPEGAPTVIGVLPPERPTVVPLVRYHAVQVGEHVYEGWQSGEPIDERWMSWTLIYKVIDRCGEGDVIAEHRVTAPWRCDGVAGLRDEIAAYGLTLTEHDECVVVRRRPPLDGPGTA